VNQNYEASYRSQMDQFYPGLWERLDLLPTLEPELAKDVLVYLLSFCRNQNIANIMIGRRAIAEIPRDWLLKHIEKAAQFLCTYNDEWEYRRLGELHQALNDPDLMRRYIQRGFDMDNLEILEAAQDFARMLEAE
jgi:hypothetical protein